MKATLLLAIVLLLLTLFVQEAMSQTDIQAVSILTPQSGEIKPQKNTFEISATFKNIGSSIVPRFDIFANIYDVTNNKLVFTSGSQIQNLYPDSTKVVNFLTVNGLFDLRSLPIGSYKINIFATGSLGDLNKKNDTCFSTFSIGTGIAPNDLSINEITTPVNNANFPVDTTISFVARVLNSGKNSESNVPVKLVVKNRDSVTIYSDITTINSVVPGFSLPLLFKPFKCPPGSFVARAYPMLPTEDYFKDDTCWSRFSAGLPNDFGITTIRSPEPNESLELGVSFHPIVTIRWVGATKPPSSLTVRYQILSIDNSAVVLTLDTIIKNVSSSESMVTLPSSQKLLDTKDLPLGYYLLKVFSMLSVDNDRTNDTLTVPFQIGIPSTSKNVALLNLSPTDNELVSIYYEHSASVRVYNAGTTAVENFNVISRIKSRTNKVLYQDTISIKTLPQNQFLDLTFPPHGLTENNIYLIEATAAIPGDGRLSDNFLQSHITTSPSDITLIKINSPSNGKRFAAGTNFILSCSAVLSPRWVPVYYEPLQIVVTDSATHSILYIGYTSISFLDTVITPQNISFPTDMAGLNISLIPPGSYKMYFIVSPNGDVNRHNDTVSTYFTIYDPTDYDVNVSSIIDPKPNAMILKGSALTPTVEFEWPSAESILKNIPVRLEIRPQGKNEIVFRQDTLVSQLLQTNTMVFNFKSVSLEESGCYEIRVFSRLNIDPNRSNDTASNIFCIEALSVEDNNDSRSVDFTIFPNPVHSSATLNYSFPSSGNVSLRILDIMGRSVQEFPISMEIGGAHSRSFSLKGCSQGTYIAELEYTPSDGKIFKRRIPIMLIK